MDSNIIKLFIEFGQKSYTQIVKLSNRFPFIIGRESPDLTIKDSSLSRKHCQLSIDQGKLFIEDLGSSGGVEVNGINIKRRSLKVDDNIRLGSTRIKVIQIELANPKKPRGGGSF